MCREPDHSERKACVVLTPVSSLHRWLWRLSRPLMTSAASGGMSGSGLRQLPGSRRPAWAPTCGHFVPSHVDSSGRPSLCNLGFSAATRKGPAEMGQHDPSVRDLVWGLELNPGSGGFSRRYLAGSVHGLVGVGEAAVGEPGLLPAHLQFTDLPADQLAPRAFPGSWEGERRDIPRNSDRPRGLIAFWNGNPR